MFRLQLMIIDDGWRFGCVGHGIMQSFGTGFGAEPVVRDYPYSYISIQHTEVVLELRVPLRGGIQILQAFASRPPDLQVVKKEKEQKAAQPGAHGICGC
jgi:hypothetical protein